MADTSLAGPSIRAQAKKTKGQQNIPGDKSSSKSVVKAVLANPLTVPWPSIPRHLQTTVLANLPPLVPTEVAVYHTDRARCHQADKRKKRSDVKETAAKEATAVPAGGDKEDGAVASVRPGDPETAGTAGPSKRLTRRDATDESPGRPTKRPKSSTIHPPNLQTPSLRPDRPAILPHLVFGINEVIKSLEVQTSALRLRVMMIGDALAEQQKGSALKPGKGQMLLPTAPPREEDVALSDEEEEVEMAEAGMQQSEPSLPLPSAPPSNLSSTDPPTAHLEWIIIPLLSISPANLVSPIPAYCATYNTLVYQYTHISKIARTRLPQARADELIGEAAQEVRVVPLGKVEEEISALAGLRRVACLGIRSSHPQIEILRKILPKSILHPPRHSLTLPFPTSALTVTSSMGAAIPSVSSLALPGGTRQAREKQAQATALLPHIHYAPLHVKGITTTIPADGNAKKQKRMEEVRAKRRSAKERKKLERVAAN